jgi:hypothetical protein
VQAIEDARSKRIDDELTTFLAKRFGKAAAPAIMAVHEQEEGRPIETLWDVTVAATAFARSRMNTDKRLEIEHRGRAAEIGSLSRGQPLHAEACGGLGVRSNHAPQENP